MPETHSPCPPPKPRVKPPVKCLSLGWGKQSWCLAAMAALGEIEMPHLVVHADTSWERQSTYSFAAQWGPWLLQHGIPYYVADQDPKAHGIVFEEWEGTLIPAFTINPPGRDGHTVTHGQLRRQCTQRWKIQPVRRAISDYLEEMHLTKDPGIVEQWIGITLDEAERMSDSDVKYINNRYPLIDLEMTRADCITWLLDHGLPVPDKSSCTFCPYRSILAWQELIRIP